MRSKGFRGRTVSEHAWLGAKLSPKDKTREHAADNGRADSPVYTVFVGDARKLTRHGGEARNGALCYMLRNGQPTTARERRGETIEPMVSDAAPRVQTPGPPRESVRLSAEDRADAEVRAWEAFAERKLRRMQLARAGLLSIGE